jgi:hypothetical protein
MAFMSIFAIATIKIFLNIKISEQCLGVSGCTYDWVEIPKHMHQKTFDRLVNEIEHYEEISSMAMSAKLGILDRF